MSPARYRKISIAALVALCTIVVTGAAVRLSGSGLGCADWPRCNAQKLIDVSTPHGAIEQVNRLFTGVVGIAVVAAVLGAMRRVPRRRELTVLAALIALGVPMQGLVGAVVVLTKLNPFANQQHFLLSMILVALGTVLVRHSGEADDGVRQPAVTNGTRSGVRLLGVLTGVALVTGTFVTGAGPHAGDEEAKRFDVAISLVARIHGVAVMCAIAAALLLFWRLRSRHADRHVLDNALTTWTLLAISQAAVGYTQYFSGVPAVLVGIHVALATGLWLATVQLWLETSTVVPTEVVIGASGTPTTSVGETLQESRTLVDRGGTEASHRV